MLENTVVLASLGGIASSQLSGKPDREQGRQLRCVRVEHIALVSGVCAWGYCPLYNARH